jgi:hypothetical protein
MDDNPLLSHIRNESILFFERLGAARQSAHS